MGFMKTEQEQIKQIEKVLKYAVADYKHLKKKGVCYCYAETLIDHGYGDVSEYKAEREMLGSQIKVLKQRLNNKYVEIERLKDDYAKLQEQFAQYQMASDKEIKAQKKEAEQRFESNMKAVLEIEKKQAQIDVLNRVMTYINNKIENDYGDMSDSVNYLTIDIDDFDDFIDELIREVQNGKIY